VTALDIDPFADLRLTEWTSCGGCAAKWGAALLTDMVRDMPAGADPSLLVERRNASGGRTRVLIASLLNFARQAPGEKILVDINSVVQTALKHNQPQFSARRVEVHLSLADDLKQVSGDPNQLLQVFLHIASNSQQALEEVGGGIFSVKTRQKDDTVILELSDNGPGARDPERVFDPFYTTRSVGKGAGLGLSACYGIIQDHHGRILCTNRVEGGMTIHIELPVAGTPPLEGSTEVAAKLPSPTEGTAATPPLVN
jgi:two-component system NtrC family sensor kinase